MQPRTVFLVEDEKLIRIDAGHRLKRLGYDLVGYAASGEEALERIPEAKPDVVLMDITLAGELDGVHTALALNEKHDAPVIYLTAHTDEDTLRRAGESNPFGYLIKPLDDERLKTAVEIALIKHESLQKLKLSEEKFRALFEKMLSGFALLEAVPNGGGGNSSLSFIDVNPAFERLTGVPRAELVGQNLLARLPQLAGFWIDVLEEAAHKRSQMRFENFFLGRESYVEAAVFSPSKGRAALIVNDITEKKRTEEKLFFTTFHDPLTNLPNRALCLDRIRQALERSRRRAGYNYAVLYLDLDRFKMINDSLGHPTGDKLLKAVADRLRDLLRGLDTAARMGGDEFVVLLEEITSPREAVAAAGNILKAIEEPFDIAGRMVHTSAAMGVVLGPTDYDLPEELLQNAAIAMNIARAQGGGRLKIFQWDMREKVRKAMDVEAGLREALEKNEFEVHFQPILRLAQAEPIGFEALIRRRRDGKLIPPSEFIPVAEATGLIIPIGEFVFAETCRIMRRWDKLFAGQTKPVLSINLSAKQFLKGDLVETLARIVRDIGPDPSRIKLEITESVVMDNPDAAVFKLKKLKDLGFQLAMDDFGTGYSSLNYLRKFPLDTLKVDRSFVSGMEQRENQVIVRTVVNLAHNLGLDVTAEGIETKNQVDDLVALRCEHGQGFYFSRPLPAVDAEKWLKRTLDEDAE